MAGSLLELLLNQFKMLGLTPSITVSGGSAVVVVHGEDIKRMIESQLPERLKGIVSVEAGDIKIIIRVAPAQ